MSFKTGIIYYFSKKDSRAKASNYFLKLITDNNKYDIKFNDYGKPSCIRPDKMNFNISYGENIGICIFVPKYKVGIDIEKVKEMPFQGIVKKYFSIEEQNFLNKYNQNAQLIIFYIMWTIKEAYIKCIGRGMEMIQEAIFSVEFYEKILCSNSRRLKFNSFEFLVHSINNYIYSICIYKGSE
ncbi:4'-phosphopantetheinyl transferase superfamily protein [Listeria welshimeri]|nr:4'-phosphopantetheinyl transferase superfamily protein [Listeria welshimeri]